MRLSARHDVRDPVDVWHVGRLRRAVVAQPFQAMNSNAQLDYGYRETKVDPSHYTVIYAGENQNTAETYLVKRAAQVARDAGYTYFAFDSRGVQVLKRAENDLVAPQRVKGPRDMGASNVNDYVPDMRRVSLTVYYYAWGHMALLSPAQAQTNPAALQVSAVLGQGNATP